MSAAKEPMIVQSEVTVLARVARKPYPGATLRHLGSVRDVTLLKTQNAHEGVGTKHT